MLSKQSQKGLHFFWRDSDWHLGYCIAVICQQCQTLVSSAFPDYGCVSCSIWLSLASGSGTALTHSLYSCSGQTMQQRWCQESWFNQGTWESWVCTVIFYAYLFVEVLSYLSYFIVLICWLRFMFVLMRDAPLPESTSPAQRSRYLRNVFAPASFGAYHALGSRYSLDGGVAHHGSFDCCSSEELSNYWRWVEFGSTTRGLCSISTHAGSVVLQRNLRMSDCSCQIWQGLSTALDLGLSSFWHASVHRCSRLAETFAPVQSLLQRCAERFWSFLWKARIRYNKVTLTESANHYRASQHVHESTALDQYFSSSKLRKKLRSQYFVYLGFGEHKPKKSTNLLIV
jgi:hypothetical protein